MQGRAAIRRSVRLRGLRGALGCVGLGSQAKIKMALRFLDDAPLFGVAFFFRQPKDNHSFGERDPQGGFLASPKGSTQMSILHIYIYV